MKTFKQFQEAAFAPAIVGGISKIPATIGAFTTLFNMAKKKNYGINLRVNRKAKKDDYYDGGEEKEKKKIQAKITKKDKKDVDRANKKMLKDITQKSKNPELEKNPVYQQLNRPTDINQFEDVVPTNNASSGAIAGLPPDTPPLRRKKRYIYGGTGSRKMWMNNK